MARGLSNTTSINKERTMKYTMPTFFPHSMPVISRIERLDVAQAAHRIGVKPQDLYNARASGRDGGFVQKDIATKKLYVLSTEVEALKGQLQQRAAGAVKVIENGENYIGLHEIAAQLGTTLQAIYEFRKSKRDLWPVTPVRQKGLRMLFPASIVEELRGQAKWGRQVNKPRVKVAIEVVKEPEPITPPAICVAAPVKALTWTDVAVALADEQPQAALWVLKTKVASDVL